MPGLEKYAYSKIHKPDPAYLVFSAYAYYPSLIAFLVKSVDVDLARLSRKTVFRKVFHHSVFFDDLMILYMSYK